MPRKTKKGKAQLALLEAKVQRHACQASFLKGTLERLGEEYVANANGR
jgi:hypothetical protein